MGGNPLVRPLVRVVALVVACAWTCGCVETRLETRKHPLQIETQPPGAQVWIQDESGKRLVGQSPVLGEQADGASQPTSQQIVVGADLAGQLSR